jgi:hypothetical protein
MIFSWFQLMIENYFMTSRERVKAAIQWQSPDRIPVYEDFWTNTLTVWEEQGLPESGRFSEDGGPDQV